MKKLSFLLVALLVTGVAFAEKNCKKKAGGKACCKKEAGAKACCKKGGETPEAAHNEATTEGGSHTITYNAAAAAPKACCKKGAEGKACHKKESAANAAKDMAPSDAK